MAVVKAKVELGTRNPINIYRRFVIGVSAHHGLLGFWVQTESELVDLGTRNYWFKIDISGSLQ